jgi:hypothetical protein
MKPVADPIHIVSQQHVFQGKGLACSQCGRPASDPIHLQRTGDLDARVVALEAGLADLNAKLRQVDDRLKAVESKAGMAPRTATRAVKRPR